MKAYKVGFWIWSGLQTKDDIRSKMSEFRSERIAILRQTELLVVQMRSI